LKISSTIKTENAKINAQGKLARKTPVEVSRAGNFSKVSKRGAGGEGNPAPVHDIFT